MQDLPTTEFYDSLHFKAVGKPETYDVGVRLWRLGVSGAIDQYRKLAQDVPGARPTRFIGDASLEAEDDDSLALAFVDRAQGTVVSVTCGRAQCTDKDMVLRIAKLIESRFDALESIQSLEQKDAEVPKADAQGSSQETSQETSQEPSREGPNDVVE